MAAGPFELVHYDTWGPYQIPTHSGYRYFLTIVDDYTRYTWTYLMKNKLDALTVVPRFFAYVDTQFGTPIKCFRFDNAPELSFTEFFSSRGVLHQFSYDECPEQNSVVERKHQHLLNLARALMFQSRIPLKFWGECILTTSFLINRTPSSAVE
ncbi:integrase catalytic domain-containing protein [Candidatus Phytoplasma australasiaticum]|uniref:integrase catalytic domain-containing protein n=1 Tax=Candidatus Phytoplasma australasiaticum TaxID=2754999 RepID=UPI003B98525A